MAQIESGEDMSSAITVQLYMSNPEEYCYEEQYVNDWLLCSVVCSTKDIVIFKAKSSHGLPALVKMNRHCTGIPEKDIYQSTWIKCKLHRWTTWFYRFSGTKNKCRALYDPIENEQRVYWKLTEASGSQIPPLLDFGYHSGRSFLIHYRYGDSVRKMLEYRGHLSFLEICRIGINIIQALKELHSVGYIYQNIDLDNIVYGQEGFRNKIYLINYIETRKYRTFLDCMGLGGHVEHFEGCCMFASLSAHEKVVQTRRDDLESTMYLIIYLFQGSLPWEKEAIQCDWERVGNLKRLFIHENKSRELPCEIQSIVNGTFRLGKFDRPPYELSISYLSNLCKKSSNQQ